MRTVPIYELDVVFLAFIHFALIVEALSVVRTRPNRAATPNHVRNGILLNDQVELLRVAEPIGIGHRNDEGGGACGTRWGAPNAENSVAPARRCAHPRRQGAAAWSDR